VLRFGFLVFGAIACVAAWAVCVDAQPAPSPVPQIILTPPPPYTPPPTPLPSPVEGQPAASPPVAAPSPPPTFPPPAPPPATPSPYRFVYTPAPVPGATDAPSDAPSIIEIDLTDRILRAPGPLNIRVVTNSPVSIVTMHVLGRDLPLPKTGDGLFSVDNQLPSLPFWLHGKTYQVDFIAAVPDGRSVKVTIPVTLR
jgi:hypothetical protein